MRIRLASAFAALAVAVGGLAIGAGSLGAGPFGDATAHAATATAESRDASVSALASEARASAVRMSAARVSAAQASAAQVSAARSSALRAYADADDDTPVSALTVDRFDAVFDLHRDADKQSSMTITETISVRFPEGDVNHGIERAIPTYNGDIPLRPHVVSITDGDGVRQPYTTVDPDDTGYDDDSLVLRIGNKNSYVHGSKTYVLRYTVQNVVRHFADEDDAELYWDVNGTGWSSAIGEASVTVKLGDGTASALNGKLSCYPVASEAASDEPCAIDRSGDTITSSVSGLNPYKSLTVAVGFDNAAFAEPTPAADEWQWAVIPWLFFIPLLVGVAWVIYLRTGPFRDAKGRGIIVPQYDAPAGVWPMLAADFVHNSSAAFPAELIGLAVQKYVSLAEDPRAPKSTRYSVTLLNNDWSALDQSEVYLLQILFPTATVGHHRVLDQNDQSLGDSLGTQRASAAKRVTALGLRQKTRSTANAWMRVLFVVVLAAAIVHLVFAALNHAGAWWVILPDIAAAVFGVVLLVLARNRDRITDKGAEVRDHLKGLREYIELAEADRIAFLQSPTTAERVDVTDQGAVIKLYEKVLPYAMVLGVSEQWVKVLQDHYATTGETSPDWYSGPGPFIALAVWSSAVSTSSFATTPAATSSGSSSFGGSGGGGFSGGGGGGGGGGGW